MYAGNGRPESPTPFGPLKIGFVAHDLSSTEQWTKGHRYKSLAGPYLRSLQLQQQRAQQPLRRDRRAPYSRIQLVKAWRQLLEDFIGHLTHRAQGMIRRH